MPLSYGPMGKGLCDPEPNEGDVDEGKKKRKNHPVPVADGGARWDGDVIRARDAFSRLLISSPVAASVRAGGGVCPFCLCAEISGHAVDEMIEYNGRAPREYSAVELRERLEKGLLNNGWLEAATVAHNREMHASNGNLDMIYDNEPARTSALDYMHGMFWDMATIQEEPIREERSAAVKLTGELPKVYYSRKAQRGYQAYANAGTLHQFFASRARYADLAEEEGESKGSGVSTTPSAEEAGTSTTAMLDETLEECEGDSEMVKELKRALKDTRAELSTRATSTRQGKHDVPIKEKLLQAITRMRGVQDAGEARVGSESGSGSEGGTSQNGRGTFGPAGGGRRPRQRSVPFAKIQRNCDGRRWVSTLV